MYKQRTKTLHVRQNVPYGEVSIIIFQITMSIKALLRRLIACYFALTLTPTITGKFCETAYAAIWKFIIAYSNNFHNTQLPVRCQTICLILMNNGNKLREIVKKIQHY